MSPVTICLFLLQSCYLNILTGACFAIGLKFAGTSDPTATDLLVCCFVYFLVLFWGECYEELHFMVNHVDLIVVYVH